MLNQEAVGRAPSAPATRAPRRDALVAALAATVVILLVVAVVLGAMLVTSEGAASPSTDLIDRNIAAWNEFDEATIRSLYADDAFIFASSESDSAASGIEEIVSLARWGGFSIERLGPVTERASLVYYPVHIATTYDVQGDVAVVVMELLDGKINQHWVVWGTE
jgi:hypothetical protein